MVCHDCCCGTDRKHPGVDHQSHRDVLLALHSDAVRVRVVDCLDACERSNVVLVRDHARPRRQRDTWLAQIHDGDDVQAVAAWVQGGDRATPDALTPHVFAPPRQQNVP